MQVHYSKKKCRVLKLFTHEKWLPHVYCKGGSEMLSSLITLPWSHLGLLPHFLLLEKGKNKSDLTQLHYLMSFMSARSMEESKNETKPVSFTVGIQFPVHKQVASISCLYFTCSNMNYFKWLWCINPCVLVSIKLDFHSNKSHYIVEFLICFLCAFWCLFALQQ